MYARTYSELITISDYEDRFRYLKLNGSVGTDTFGFDRWFNQQFYRSKEWKSLREKIIIRDNGCDLAMPGFEIHSKIIIHHMNPISLNDIFEMTDYLINPDYLICVSHNTHNAIHYGDENLLDRLPIERKINDTCLWK